MPTPLRLILVVPAFVLAMTFLLGAVLAFNAMLAQVNERTDRGGQYSAFPGASFDIFEIVETYTRAFPEGRLHRQMVGHFLASVCFLVAFAFLVPSEGT